MKTFVLIFSLINLLSPITESKEAKKAIIEDYQKIKHSIQESELKKRKVLSALFEINNKIKKIVFNQSRIRVDLVVIEKSIKELNDSIEELNTEIGTQKKYLAYRLRSLYQNQSASFLEYLLTAKSNAEIDRSLRWLTRLAQHDREVIASLNFNREKLNLNKMKLEKKKQELMQTKNESEEKEKEFAREEKLKTQILKGVQKSQLFAADRLEDVRQKSRKFIKDPAVVELIYKPSFYAQKKQLKPPLDLDVTQGFGIIEEDSYQLPHRGIYYKSLETKEVRSVFEGIVKKITDLPYFGKTVILDHGDHYYSTYAFLKNVKVREGESISNQQIIGQTGVSSDGSLQGLYFELRHFSEPQDPQFWLVSLYSKEKGEKNE